MVKNPTTSEEHAALTNAFGGYSLLQLPPAHYDLTIHATGFSSAATYGVVVDLAETTTVNFTLQVGHGAVDLTVRDASALVRSDSSEISTTLDSRTLTELPLPTRNFLQLLNTAPGVSAPLTNNSSIGRNSPNISVDGSRVTQNNYQINGVDANDVSFHVFADVAVPAPESVSQVNVRTSLYDASSGGAGGSVQLITRSGGNVIHGGAYEYFQNEALDANDPNLKAVSEARPRMRRNVIGAMLGGPIVRNKSFFFLSYQGSREVNGATDQSLYKDVLIAPGLTGDRSASTLMATFQVPRIDPISLGLLNFKLPNGQFLIPTPNAAGLVTGSALSRYDEDQFNTNLDDRIGTQDSLAAKFFFARAPLFSALAGSNFGVPSSLPGFGTDINVENRVLSLQELHTFSATTVNEVLVGYNFIRHDEVPQESVDDGTLGMQRSTAAEYPGLPLILLARDQGGASLGTSDITYRGHLTSLSLGDILSLQRGAHTLRLGGDFGRLEWLTRAGIFSYGEIDFPSFDDFLMGNTGPSQFIPGSFGFSHLGTGIPDRDTLTSDYHLFIQDEWKVNPKVTVNLGLRYELDLPPYDSQGRIGGFDPTLYKPPLNGDAEGLPIGPPSAGILEAGNALPQYTLPGVTRVGRRIVRSSDPNNFGPRVGLAWSPLSTGRLALRAGYGIFYSRPAFSYLALQYFAPPFFLVSDTSGQPFATPFKTAPPDSSFPLVEPGSTIDAEVVDRAVRTPYTQQFNTSVQFQIARDTTLQIGYAGSRGIKLFRVVAINQAQIASIDHPITNPVTGQILTDNTNENAALRAPFQGVSTGGFALNESSAQSTYHSLQTSLHRQSAHGLSFTAAYTFSRSIDDASNPGGGANIDGTGDRSGGLDTGNVWGNQLTARGNRGLSDFDRTHYFVLNGVWELPTPTWGQSSAALRSTLAHWQISGLTFVMSGLPVDIFDPSGGSLYGLFGARPNWAPGANRETLTKSPMSYYFNPSAFVEAVVQPGQTIPSAHDPTALAGDLGTDLGNVGRNVLRGPGQSDVDFSIAKLFPWSESKKVEFRADFFNLLNHASRDNPVSDITSPNFGKILSFSSSPRIVQLALRVTF